MPAWTILAAGAAVLIGGAALVPRVRRWRLVRAEVRGLDAEWLAAKWKDPAR